MVSFYLSPQHARHLIAISQILSKRRQNVFETQLSRLNEILDHTWKHHPRFAGWWREHGLTPTPLKSLEDLGRYPVMRKSQYQVSKEQLLAEGFRGVKLTSQATSGSTGVPLAIYRTPLEDLVLRACRLRTYFNYGLAWRDRRVSMRTGSGAAFGGSAKRRRPAWMNLGLLQVDSVSHIALDPAGVVKRLREIGPAVLSGHAEAIWRLSLEVPSEHLRQLGLKFMTAGVQTVTPDMRQRISSAFGCPLYVTYGASEFNMLAAQCPSTGLFHLTEEGAYVEVLRDGRPAQDGEEGEVYATNLHAFAIPYVRYALDDWATVGPSRCPCGAPVRTLREIQGRVSEFFYFSSGIRVHPFQLTNPLLEFIGWLREYRVVQVSREEVDIWYTVLNDAPIQPRRPGR